MSWDLEDTSDGLKKVYAKCRSSDGTESDCIFDSITLDTTAPDQTALVISSGEDFTTSTSVSLGLSANNATKMYISNNPTCSVGGVWEDFVNTKLWTLEQTNGVATVYVRFKDLAGNVSSCISDTIIHDDIPPSDPGSFSDSEQSMILTQTTGLGWTPSSDAGSGVDYYEVRIGSTVNGSDILDWTGVGNVNGYTVTGLSLMSADTYYADIRAYDQAGNVSSVVSSDGFYAGLSWGVDTSFDTDGVFQHDDAAGGASDDVGLAVATLDNGKIVVVGYSNNNSADYDKDLAVWMLNADGSLDTSFSGDGIFTHHNAAGGDGADEGRAVAIQSDGKIVVAGDSWGSNKDFAIWRLNTDGTLDSDFGSSGVFTWHSGNSGDLAYDLEILADGSILVTGSHYIAGEGNNMIVFKLSSTGVRDLTFGSEGGYFSHHDAAGGDGGDSGMALAVDAVGNIFVAGESAGSTDNDLVIWKLTSAGVLNTSYDSNGYKVYDDGNNQYAFDIALQADGKVLATGRSDQNGRDMFVVRTSSTGSFDTTFGGNGEITHDGAGGSTNTFDYGRSLHYQADGKIMVIGYSPNVSGKYLATVWRLLSDGSLDTDFNSVGYETYSASGGTDAEESFSHAIGVNGTLFTVGSRSTGSTGKDMTIWKIGNIPPP